MSLGIRCDQCGKFVTHWIEAKITERQERTREIGAPFDAKTMGITIRDFCCVEHLAQWIDRNRVLLPIANAPEEVNGEH